MQIINNNIIIYIYDVWLMFVDFLLYSLFFPCLFSGGRGSDAAAVLCAEKNFWVP
jgi:hypothetical protein